MARATQHIHAYERVNIGKKNDYFVYKCSLPNCSHYLPLELVIGKLSICPHCEEAFQIERSDLKVYFDSNDKTEKGIRKPHCKNCVDPTRVAIHEELKRQRVTPEQLERVGKSEKAVSDLVDKFLTIKPVE